MTSVSTFFQEGFQGSDSILAAFSETVVITLADDTTEEIAAIYDLEEYVDEFGRSVRSDATLAAPASVLPASRKGQMCVVRDKMYTFSSFRTDEVGWHEWKILETKKC